MFHEFLGCGRFAGSDDLRWGASRPIAPSRRAFAIQPQIRSRRPNSHPRKKPTQRYYIYAVTTSGWSLLISRPAEVEGRPSNSFLDGGTGDAPVQWKKLVEKEF